MLFFFLVRREDLSFPPFLQKYTCYFLIYMPRILELEDTSAKNKSGRCCRWDRYLTIRKCSRLDQCWATLKIYIQPIRIYAIYTVWNSTYTKYWITQLKSHYSNPLVRRCTGYDRSWIKFTARNSKTSGIAVVSTSVNPSLRAKLTSTRRENSSQKQPSLVLCNSSLDVLSETYKRTLKLPRLKRILISTCGYL